MIGEFPGDKSWVYTLVHVEHGLASESGVDPIDKVIEIEIQSRSISDSVVENSINRVVPS